MADTETVDYLGASAPLSLESKALPTPGPLAPSAGAPSVGGGGSAAPSSLSSRSTLGLRTQPGGVTTGDTGSAYSLPEGARNAILGLPKEAQSSLLEKLAGLGGDFAKVATAVKKLFEPPSEPSLPTESGVKTEHAQTLDEVSPSEISDPAGLMRTLPNPINEVSGGELTDLGTVPMSFDESLLANMTPGNIASFFGPLLSLGSKFATGDTAKGLGAGGTVVGGVTTAITNPVLAAWNLPSIVDSLDKIFDSDAGRVKRGAERTGAATELGGEILSPLRAAKSPEEFVAALKTPVGGSTVGDAIASMLRTNASGTYFADTAHGWLPDKSLGPLREVLTQLGYTGFSEPSKGDVGGVGEIIMGGAPGSITKRELEIAANPSTMTQDERMKYGYGFDPENPANGPGLPSPAQQWERTLRSMTEEITGVPITAPSDVLSAQAGIGPEQERALLADYGTFPAVQQRLVELGNTYGLQNEFANTFGGGGE